MKAPRKRPVRTQSVCYKKMSVRGKIVWGIVWGTMFMAVTFVFVNLAATDLKLHSSLFLEHPSVSFFLVLLPIVLFFYISIIFFGVVVDAIKNYSKRRRQEKIQGVMSRLKSKKNLLNGELQQEIATLKQELQQLKRQKE